MWTKGANLSRFTRGPCSRYFSGSHVCQTCAGSTTWSSTLMIFGSSIRSSVSAVQGCTSMRIGVTGGLWFHEVDAAQWGDIARHVEGLGFESLWSGDHLALPAALPEGYPYTDDGHVPFPSDTPLHDPLVVLAAMATATTRVRLGTPDYPLPLRPAVAAPRA